MNETTTLHMTTAGRVHTKERLSLGTIVYGGLEHEATTVHDERCW